ncbi:MAG TPA: prepilin-type N-terminal cleavage/methylation domain-containing protein [Candidatus Saccharimonadales bacterium]|nr:prepilin-type N-terminal cleavage/methylation domain-containing protein [Candidatus Saccharimonadales bacterium]
MDYKTTQKGITLIETIIYIAIVSLIMTSLIPFAWNVIEGGVKSSTEQEVFDNARFISEQIKYQIRNATGINSVSSTQISLATANSATNPTIIGVSGTNLTMQQGAGSALNLNSQNATVSGVTFMTYTSGDNKTKNIQFVFTVNANYSGSGSRQELNESTTIEGDAEVRSN